MNKINDEKVQLFEDQAIRNVWYEENEEWYFSVVDVCKILTEVENPRRYWSDLKRKLKEEGSELYDKIVQLKLKSPKDGKRYNIDVARQGGEVAATAREALEKRTGKSVVTSRNAMQLNHVVEEMIEASVVTSEDE